MTGLGELRDVKGTAPTATPRFLHLGQKWVSGELDHRYRGIWRIESNDLEHWGGGSWIVRREPHDEPNLEFYHASCNFLATETYHGLHIGYYYPFHTDPAGEKTGDDVRLAGTIDTELMVSRDTIHWTRVKGKQPFFPVGKAGKWDAGMVFLAPPMVLDRQLRFYYGAWKNDHAAQTNIAAVGLATLRLDGFVSLEAKDGAGLVVTKPFRFLGDRLEINADAADGRLLVEVLDTAGKPVEGFTAESCRPITTDGLRHNVTWSSRKHLASLKGETLRLRFHLKDGAKLYAFQFRHKAATLPKNQ